MRFDNSEYEEVERPELGLERSQELVEHTSALQKHEERHAVYFA